MLDFPRWKVWWTWLLILVGTVFAVPNFFPKEQVATWPSFVPRAQVSLGLDLAGGSQLLLEADARDAARQRLQAMEETVTTELRRGEPRIAIGDVSTREGRLSFLVRDPTQLDAAVERLRTLTQPVGLTGTRDWNVSVEDSTRIILTPTEQGSARSLSDSMTVARDVVRRRIDPQGTREVTVVNQGARRILVQVPGVEDPDALKALIGQTARLEFKLVDQLADPEQVAQGRAPAGSQVLPMADGSGQIAVQRRVMVSGEQLIDAKQSFDQDGQPVVSITFNSAGARRFGRVTQENVNKPFAIILDDKVLSAPNINEPILGGQAQISGNFTVETANQLAVALASGKLPVKLNVIEERTVGPELGKDSIEKGLVASVVATLAVIIFMLGGLPALALMADWFPKSTFVGYDLSDEATAWARAEAARAGRRNLSFVARDLSRFAEEAEDGAFDFVTTFDAIHDQAKPASVLRGIRRSLAAGGVYLAQDINGSCHHHKNVGHPIGTLLYTVSCLHCMTVSLAQGGDGLGAMWGREMAERYIGAYWRSVVDHYELEGTHLQRTKGYESYGRMQEIASAPGGADAMTQFFLDLQVWGTPEQCYEKIMTIKALTGAGAYNGVFSYGGMPWEDAERSMRLFARTVLPRLQALDDAPLGLPRPAAA